MQELAEKTSPANTMETGTRWLRLCCHEQTYALELLKVQEVVRPTPLLSLRGTSSAMLGIMNLRGQVVPVLDFGLHLASSAIVPAPSNRIVVLEEHGELLGLLVSKVEDVATLHPCQIEPASNARPGCQHDDAFCGIARDGNVPVILLDASTLLGAAA